jgi:hypothetical protein
VSARWSMYYSAVFVVVVSFIINVRDRTERHVDVDDCRIDGHRRHVSIPSIDNESTDLGGEERCP